MLLNAGTSLPAVRRYIRMNPARKMWKERNADRFVRFADLRHPVLDSALPWAAVGDLTLLGSPFLVPASSREIARGAASWRSIDERTTSKLSGEVPKV